MTEHTGTGTRAAPPYAVTAAALLADCRAALADAGDTPAWSDAELLIFLNEAIREYSQHLPRVAENLDVLLPVLPHALDLLTGRPESGQEHRAV